jgi:hypothetical protein
VPVVVTGAGRVTVAAGLKDFAAPAVVRDALAAGVVAAGLGSIFSVTAVGGPEAGRADDGFMDDGVDLTAVRGPAAFFDPAVVPVVLAAGFRDFAGIFGDAVGAGAIRGSVDPPVTAWRSLSATSSSTVLRFVLTSAPSRSS